MSTARACATHKDALHTAEGNEAKRETAGEKRDEAEEEQKRGRDVRVSWFTS